MVLFKLGKLIALSQLLLEGRDRISFTEEFQHLAHDLTHPRGFSFGRYTGAGGFERLPEKGVRWLQMLHHYGFGGILADIGLTLQTIAFDSR